MKRKSIPAPAAPFPESTVPDVIVEQAKLAIEAERNKKPAQCVVCGGECAPSSVEGLCWVCRRLKLSAWRDSDPQISAQE